MEKGKCECVVKHRHKKKKTFSLLLSIVLLLTLAAGGTLAYIVTKSAMVQNQFVAGYVTSSVNNDGTVTNIGNVDAYIRASAVANWVDDDGNIYAGTASCTLSGLDWSEGSDGFYYYRFPVGPDNATTALKAEPSGTGPEGCTLQVTIVAEAIQSEGGAVASAWRGAPSLNS